MFTQTTVDEDGYPVRDQASTTYTGAIETAEEFARRIYSEAWQRGWARARQHLWDLARKLHPGDDVAHKRWLLAQLDRLENGKIENLVAELRSTPAATAEIADTLRIEVEYFNKDTNIRSFVAKGSLSVRVSSKQAAKLRLAVSSSQACSGPSVAPTPLLPFAAID